MFKLKKYLLFLSVLVFLLLFVFLTKSIILAQPSLPSFELYYNYGCSDGNNCTTYPLVLSEPVQPFPTAVIITAYVFDVSGTSSVVAKIQDPNHPGQFMNIGSGIMKDDGVTPDESASDDVYSLLVNTSGWPSGTYKVDILATDILSQTGEYDAVEQFAVAGAPGTNCRDNE
jgi:hypothetical protein